MSGFEVGLTFLTIKITFEKRANMEVKIITLLLFLTSSNTQGIKSTLLIRCLTHTQIY